jgi:hypothetical protein
MLKKEQKAPKLHARKGHQHQQENTAHLYMSAFTRSCITSVKPTSAAASSGKLPSSEPFCGSAPCDSSWRAMSLQQQQQQRRRRQQQSMSVRMMSGWQPV